MRKSRLLAGLAALSLAAVAAPAHAGPVDVTLTNTSSSRTLYVESMTGQNLTSLDFGSTRTLPFRVRVVDGSATRTPFSVSATMSNLYLNNNGTLDYTNKIASSQVSLDSQVMPLNVLNVSAAVQPLVNTVSTITDTTICSALNLLPLGATSCQLSTTGLVGNVQNVTVPVDLSALQNLPLLPQPNEKGAFTNADYGTGTAGAGDTVGKLNAPAATPYKVISGSVISTPAVLTPLQSALSTAVGTVVDPAAVTSALQAQFPTTWALLSSTQISTILSSTVATVQNLTADKILSQTGTYMSLPTLNVNVPAGVPAGNYKGTLVVTALQ